MKKKSELVFNAILVPIDFLMIVSAGLAAYFLRFQMLAETLPVIYEMSFKNYLNIILTVALIWLFIFGFSGLYAIKRSRRIIDEISHIFLACSAGVMFIIILIFLKRELFSSRFIILAGWVLAIILVSCARLFIRYFQRLLYKKGIGAHRVLIIGEDKNSQSISKALHRFPGLGYKIVGHFKSFNNAVVNKILAFKNGLGIDEIIQADPNLPREETLKLVDFCSEHHIIFKYAADILGAKSSNIEVDAIAGVPIIEIKKTPLDGWRKIIKRMFDVIGALIGLIVLSPLFIIVAIIVKLDSNGPAFVGLKRVGEKGKIFTLFKFRSMINGAEEMKKELMAHNERNGGPLFKMKHDPRITRVGRFIRKTSIDELPQLFNVWIGNMSLVGPRPHEPEEVEKYAKHHKKLLDIKPGITGMAQISGRSDLDFEEEVKLDSYYIENWSLKLDLRILFKTPKVILKDKAAC